MLPYGPLIVATWLVFVIVWVLFAVGAKRTVRNGQWWQRYSLRLALFAVFVLALELPPVREVARQLERLSASNGAVLGPMGAVLCVIGIAFAVWARVYLGRNWGTPMSLKENPELVTSGPYAYVRHPIYSGMLLALFGSALASPIWAVLFLFSFMYFFYSTKVEEKIMTEQFPDQYPAYKARTKMLIPFIF